MVIQTFLSARSVPIYVGHLQAHSDLPGPLSEGHALADKLTRQIYAVSQESYGAAKNAHNRFHLNAGSLRFHYKISREQATDIVKKRPLCVELLTVPHLGINPRGLAPNHLWQMDFTHIPSFGRLQYVHVTVDTYSHLIFASAHTGEKLRDVKSHFLQAFAYMGVPKSLKTDNGPAYTSAGFAKFCREFHISHKTGIPHNPQGQAVVERTHRTLKTYLHKTKRGDYSSTPREHLSFILYILNFLTVNAGSHTAAENHWQPSSPRKPLVKWKNLANGTWCGPDRVLTWGRGAVCIVPQDAELPIWVPECLVRTVDSSVQKPEDEARSRDPTDTAAEAAAELADS